MQIENGAIAAARDEAVAGMNRLFAKVDRDVCAALVPVQAEPCCMMNDLGVATLCAL